MAGLAVPDGWIAKRVGKDLVITPPDVPAGKYFSVTVRPAADLDVVGFDDWFSAQMDADRKRIGTLVKDNGVSSQAGGDILYCVRTYRTADGENRIGGYIGLRRSGGKAQFARILSSADNDVYTPYMKPSTQMLLSWAKATGSSGDDQPVESRRTTPTPDRAPSRSEVLRRQYTAAPGAGVKPSQILGIYLQVGTGFGVGGYVTVNYDPVLVLKDGTYYEDFDVPPADLDIEASRRLRPKAWGRWRRAGENFETLSPTKGWEKSGWTGPYPGASAGERLAGTYSHLGGGGDVAYGGGTMIAVTNNITFMPDGHFSGGSSAGVSGNYETGSVTAGSSRKYAGTYRLNGYTAELRYNDGKIERRSFVFMDKKKKDALYLDGTPYLKDDD